ncbi:MAG: type II secretion system protein [Actinobacteria bacterium]|nr:type II secretion system protein [Actinomycetota bacterium]
MRLRSEEAGFGMLELMMAVVMLTIALLALMGVFTSGTLALRSSARISNGTAVADKTMEVYRELENCAIYLSSSSIPTNASTYYTQYFADTSAYQNVGTYSATNHLWVTQTTDNSYVPIPASSSNCLPNPAPTGPDPTQATQTVTGPDGLSYLVFTYIVIVSPTGPSGTYTTGHVKEVTVEVFDPKDNTKLLAKETSIFDPDATS